MSESAVDNNIDGAVDKRFVPRLVLFVVSEPLVPDLYKSPWTMRLVERNRVVCSCPVIRLEQLHKEFRQGQVLCFNTFQNLTKFV